MTGVDYPYLVVARHPTNDPQRWELRMPLDELARRFRYPGQATGVTVSRVGPSGRALEITFTGDGGPLAVPGHRFMSQLELRSTLFTMRTEGGPAPPETQSSAAGAPSAASRSVVGVRPLVLEAGGVGPAPLGRAPWTALAVLLLALWAVTAYARLPRTQDRTLTNERSKASAV
jgi:hypothetical protein